MNEPVNVRVVSAKTNKLYWLSEIHSQKVVNRETEITWNLLFSWTKT